MTRKSTFVDSAQTQLTHSHRFALLVGFPGVDQVDKRFVDKPSCSTPFDISQHRRFAQNTHPNMGGEVDFRWTPGVHFEKPAPACCAIQESARLGAA